jgi:peptidoglycan/xylan/chitin deacetylase (PgdA/CDA1 family)
LWTIRYALVVQFLTSWDDGYVLDLRIAEMLQRFDLKGTFYICPASQHRADMLSSEQIRTLAMHHTIGAHSMTHPRLTQICREDGEKEIRQSKQWIEEVTGKPCTSFCYPYGAVNDDVKRMVKDAGYTEARTTRDLEFAATDDLLQPVTLQIAPFPLRMRFHPLWKVLDPLGPLRSRYGKLRRLGTPHAAMTSWFALAKYLYDYGRKKDVPFFHLYGHSREVEKYNMWQDLESFLAYVKHHTK